MFDGEEERKRWREDDLGKSIKNRGYCMRTSDSMGGAGEEVKGG